MMAEVMGRREGRPLYLVDLAVPRDVDDRVALIEGIHLFNIDDLQSAIEDNVERRGAAKHAAFDMIDEALEQFDEWLRKYRGRLPADFRFDRIDANTRR